MRSGKLKNLSEAGKVCTAQIFPWCLVPESKVYCKLMGILVGSAMSTRLIAGNLGADRSSGIARISHRFIDRAGSLGLAAVTL